MKAIIKKVNEAPQVAEIENTLEALQKVVGGYIEVIIMDLGVAHEQFNLNLTALLNAPDVDFTHDINGIQSNINRQEKIIENLFLPRYSRG